MRLPRISNSSASISRPKASRSRKPAPTRCSAWSVCAGKSPPGSCRRRAREQSVRRLLTTHAVTNLGEARRIVDLYRMRWTIEEFFHTLKTAGFDIEAADIGDPQAMIKFDAAATVAAVTVMQLVKARDGTTGQSLADAFDPADQPILEAVSTQLEGKTERQKNPHPKGSLAFAGWVIGRLGGWTGY